MIVLYKNFVSYDKDKILDEVTGFMVADMTGVEQRRKGKNTWIYCPGHIEVLGKIDSTMSNCILTEHGYYCFSCAKGANVITMTMQIIGCSYVEALKMLSDYIGGAEIDTKESQRSFCPLTKEDLILLKLEPSKQKTFYCPISSTSNPSKTGNRIREKKIVSFEDVEDVVYFVQQKPITYGISSLYRDDKAMYQQILRNKFIEQYTECIEEIDQIKKKAGTAFWGPFYYLAIGRKKQLIELNERLKILV